MPRHRVPHPPGRPGRTGILRDVAHTDLSTTVFDTRSALPFGMAPTGYARLMHTAGERAVVSAAGHAGIRYTLSVLGTTSIDP